MAQNSQKIKSIMDDMQSVKAGDSDADMIAKLNEIALKVAEAQGKKVSSSTKAQLNNFNNTDPMDELGCEGCQ